MINSTLRIQLSKQFTFQDALSSLPYIQSLGIDTIYCSPIFQAISDHGYDITNPNQIAPYLSNFNHFCEEVHRHGMLIILDIVPNHMGFVDGNNPWFEETIKKGQASPYAHFFDIQWKDGKIHLPILGDEKVVEKGHALYCHWKQPPNYRRFFNIQQLIAICIEKPDVLEAHHKLIFELMQSGKIDGLRIDHPDGLLLPAAYFSALRKKRRLYTVVEKILEGDEQLPNWEVDGTVGYEYLNSLNGLFVKEESEAAFTKLYAKLAGSKDFHQVALESKREFAKNYMIAEINQFDGIQQQLIEVIAHFPIYRTYAIDTPSQRDEQIIKEAISKAVKSRPDLNFDSFYDKLLPKILQFQQLTAPIMAKGVEDTAFYRYNRLLSLNEVGGNPAQFGTSKEQFQKKMLLKAQKWPLGLITTSTHDTKRSEDARMRLNLLTEFTKEWEELVCTWIDNSIDPNTAY
ncbi:MAG: malto-oligosyltrehalose synthase, partial [Chlamydiae bacterium]|nr:malto-oligosyltrehalose synthase [Chlamydiota bacterium]